MSLYHRHRPKSFEKIVGNEAVVLSLQDELQKEDKTHAFMFHGPTGCGKTTLGRIIARELGCTGADLHEIDSAQFRGIDTARKIRERSMYLPYEAESQTVIWMIDECHKMTNDAQNALLKILEDAPEHVYFILCTTDPQKLLRTVRGRCMQYEVTPLTDSQMHRLLRRVIKKEGAELAKGVLKQIIQDCEGLPRNALQILDQVIGLAEDRQLEMAKRTAELQSKTIELCRALLDGTDWRSVGRILQGLKEEGIERMRWAVMNYCNTALLRGHPRAAGIIDQFAEPFFNSGFAGFTLACYYAVNQE